MRKLQQILFLHGITSYEKVVRHDKTKINKTKRDKEERTQLVLTGKTSNINPPTFHFVEFFVCFKLTFNVEENFLKIN
jgi:hypothetical protein